MATAALVSYPPAAEAREVLVKFRVTPDEKARLERLAAERGRSMAEICRVAVLREQGRKEFDYGY